MGAVVDISTRNPVYSSLDGSVVDMSTGVVFETIDADAAAYFTAAGITDATQKDAYNTMVLALKANNLYTKFYALYPFLGGSASSHKYNAITPVDNDASFRLSFAGGWTHSSNGALPNGTTGYADTFFTPNTHFSSANSSHISVYSRTAVSAVQRDIGCFVLSDNPCMSIGSDATPRIVADSYSYTTHRITSAIANTQGLLMNTRTASNVFKAFRNATQIGSTNTTAVGSMPTISLYLGAARTASVFGYSTKQYAFASIGTGFSDADMTTLYSIIQTFQTTIRT